MMLTRGILAPNGADVFFGPGGDLHMPPPPKDSPENAAKIIGGLAIVPVGLIRRLERASPPADDVGAVGGDSGCAICWDRLLDGDGAEFASEASTSDAPATASETRIIALPCAHVFHAACLIPWFSRPGQTTCPTCRFDVDPTGLIWYDGQKNAPGPGLFDGPGGAFNFELPLFMPRALAPPFFMTDFRITDPLRVDGMDFPEMPHNHGHGGEDAEEGDGDDNIPPLEPIPHTHMPAQPQQPTQPLPPTQPPPTQTPARPNTTVTFDIVFSELGPILPPVELASVSNNMGAPPQQVLAQNHGAPNAGATPPPATTATPNTPPPAANANAPPRPPPPRTRTQQAQARADRPSRSGSSAACPPPPVRGSQTSRSCSAGSGRRLLGMRRETHRHRKGRGMPNHSRERTHHNMPGTAHNRAGTRRNNWAGRDGHRGWV
ncbi:hypothetical protein B0H10DRAFT_695153 [Mycena sp. CBHHK59/15]|nr:hypothetical protein B0H10DRAFT_695153 [Mycena sp. CBHHK59/15]